MVVRLFLVILGIALVVNGIFMLVAPQGWYDAMPGVAMTGPFNPHFISDIAMAFLASGASLALGARTGLAAAVIACSGATWPALHALVHAASWFSHGFPADRKMAFTEVVGVVLIGGLGVLLAGMRLQGEA
jgi:uncharacterized membrane protein